MHTHQKSSDAVATIGIDIGKSTFHLVGLDKRGAIVLQIKLSTHPTGAPACQCAVPPCRHGSRLRLPSHRPADPGTRPRRSPHPRAIREALSQRNSDILLANKGSRGGSPIHFIRGAGRP
jgi:hypothetical protein